MHLRSALSSEALVGTFVGINSPTVVEILAGSGYQVICVDSEHAPFSATEIQDLIRAADSRGVPAIVRVSGAGPEIGRALDSGAAGVLVPMVETAEDAANVVSLVRYPPVGRRGAGPGRATAYGADFAGYLARANDAVAAMIQVESVRGVENVEAILAVPGIDLVFVGPGDLAVSLGVPVGAPEHTAAIERIADAARAAGVPLGIFCVDDAAVSRWARVGARFFLIACDLVFLADRAAELAQASKAAAGAEVGA